MHKKATRTLGAIYENPIRSDLPWKDVEQLLKTLGAEITEGSGSIIRVALNDIRAVFHRPHPKKQTDKGALKSVRRFLSTAGIEP